MITQYLPEGFTEAFWKYCVASARGLSPREEDKNFTKWPCQNFFALCRFDGNGELTPAHPAVQLAFFVYSKGASNPIFRVCNIATIVQNPQTSRLFSNAIMNLVLSDNVFLQSAAQHLNLEQTNRTKMITDIAAEMRKVLKLWFKEYVVVTKTDMDKKTHMAHFMHERGGFDWPRLLDNLRLVLDNGNEIPEGVRKQCKFQLPCFVLVQLLVLLLARSTHGIHSCLIISFVVVKDGKLPTRLPSRAEALAGRGAVGKRRTWFPILLP